MLRLSVMAMLLSAAVADEATTVSKPELPQYFADFEMTLSLTSPEPGPLTYQYPVVPLTQYVGLNATNPNTLNAITAKGPMVIVDENNYNAFNDSSAIAYVCCDSNTETSNISPSDVLNALLSMPSKPKAILLYTTESDGVYCSLEGNSLAFNSIWSMVSSDDSWMTRNVTSAATGTITATISGKNSSDSDPSDTSSGGNNSAVAMSILYSITGLITLLFLIIIATGAVRAHRHPERYGPRAGYGGRPRQSRARGLARAVLETLPIVKFGDPHPVKGDPDNELESVTGDRQLDSPAPAQTRPSTEVAVGHITPSANTTVGDHIDATLTPAAAGSVAKSTNNNGNVNDEHLGCTICTEDFTVGEDVRVLPCDHKFHPPCIDPWLVNVSGTCPLCRLDLRPQESEEGEAAAPTEVGQPESHNTDAPENSGQETVQDRRRSRLLDWNRLRHASVDERIQALRQIREQQETPAVGASSEDSTPARLTDRLREKFHIRTRTQS
ncbi:RING-7 protein [Xylariales sp. AK1849]|nr:RING-7 protein [Xylariales sp. AK1849]